MAGPASVPAASPVRTKIPVPMITPMPIVVSCTGPRARRSLRPGWSVSSIDCSTDFVRNSSIWRRSYPHEAARTRRCGPRLVELQRAADLCQAR